MGHGIQHFFSSTLDDLRECERLLGDMIDGEYQGDDLSPSDRRVIGKLVALCESIGTDFIDWAKENTP